MNDTFSLIIGLVFWVFIFNLIISRVRRFFNKDRNISNSNYYNFKSDRNKITTANFNLRPSLMNSNERVFFEQLKIAVGGAYDIYPQVHLGAIFQPTSYGHNWAEVNKLNKKIDFVLFDKNTQTPKIAIELDGDSHSKFKSFKRDEFVSAIFQKFNIPLVRFNNGNYSSEEIENKLSCF